LFSGIGSQKQGIEDSGVWNCEVIATSDIDKDTIVSYSAIHNGLTDEMVATYSDYPSEEAMRDELISKNIGYNSKTKTNPIAKMKGDKLRKHWLATKLSNNLGDISKIESLPYADFWTYSFCCQDISVAGKQAGIIKGQTRSGLLYEVERLLEVAKLNNNLPKYLMLENVKNLVGKKFKSQFDDWLKRLSDLGYNTYWKVTNAKDCGIPQNRERVFAISIRKDIDNVTFEFPIPFDNGLRLKDMLEDVVDEKYFLSDFVPSRFQLTKPSGNVIGSTAPDFRTIGVMGTLTATDYKQPKQICNTNRCIQSYTLTGGKWDKVLESNRRIYSDEGCCPTVTTCGGGHREPKVSIEKIANKEYSNAIRVGGRGSTDRHSWDLVCVENISDDEKYIDNIDEKYQYVKEKSTDILNEKGYLPSMYNPYNKSEITDFAPTQTSRGDKAGTSGAVLIKQPNYTIRKLTPVECYRLMGFGDELIHKVKAIGMSDAQMYKQAGNSIVTNCIRLIMEHLYKAQVDSGYICSDENFTKLSLLKTR
jgi:DNA (cytosine-5)-methyltransferase 1